MSTICTWSIEYKYYRSFTNKLFQIRIINFGKIDRIEYRKYNERVSLHCIRVLYQFHSLSFRFLLGICYETKSIEKKKLCQTSQTQLKIFARFSGTKISQHIQSLAWCANKKQQKSIEHTMTNWYIQHQQWLYYVYYWTVTLIMIFISVRQGKIYYYG